MPRVFISHAKEDKESFVFDFAKKLRANGIDAWVDRWEMLPGDSVVDKIFEEGIKNAQAFVVVLSKNSVHKKWVKEELNAAVIKRIREATKLIPVVIDDCEIPEALRSTLWEKIGDLTSYESQLERIIMSILGKYEKPPLGPTPKYTQATTDTIVGLTEIDAVVYKTACDMAIEQNTNFLNIEPIKEVLKKSGITESILQESLEILDAKGYIEGTKTGRGEIVAMFISADSFNYYFRDTMKEYGELIDQVAFKIVNEEKKDSNELSSAMNKPKLVIRTIIDNLNSRGLVKAVKSSSGDWYIVSISAELKRMLRSGERFDP